MDDNIVALNAKCVEEILKLSFKDKVKTKVTSDALKLIVEVCNVFVREAISRAAIHAKDEGSSVVSPDHLEKTLPQLILDF